MQELKLEIDINMPEFDANEIYEAAKSFKATDVVENVATGNPNEFSAEDIYQAEKEKNKRYYESFTPEEKQLLATSSSDIGAVKVKGASEMFRLLGDNWIPVNDNSTEDYQNSLAANQSMGEFVSNLGSRFISNFGSGVISSFDYDLENMWNLANDKAIKETSALFDYAKKIREDAQIENPLYYNTNMEFGSRDYFAQIPEALGYSFGRIVGDIGQQALLSGLTAATFGASSGLQASVLATKLAKYSTGIAFGAFKGLQETKDNALETRENVYNEYRSMGVEHEEAMKYANEAAHLHFKMEATPLIALNALQFGMIRSTLPGIDKVNIGSYSNSVEALGKTLTKGIKNTKLSGLAETGIQMASEGFEEGMQAYFGKYAEDEIMRSSGHRGMFVDFNPMDQEMGIAIISGALGGGLFQGVGKVASSVSKKFAGNINAKLYDDLVNGTMASIIKYNTALNKAIAEGKTEEAANIRHKLQKQMVYENLAWDKKQGDDRAFNTYLSSLTEVYTALEKNDTTVLEKYGVQNTPDNKKHFKDLIEDATSIKEKFDRNYKKYEDFGVAFNLTDAEFEMEKAVQTKKKMTSNFNTELESEYTRMNVTSQRVKDFNAKMGEISFLSSIKRNEAQQQRYEQLNQELNELQEEKFSQEEVVELANTKDVIESYAELSQALDNQDKRFKFGKEKKEKLESFSGRKEYIKKRKEKELEEKRKKGNVKDIETVVNSKDTAPETKEKGQAIIDNMKAENTIKAQSPTVESTVNPPKSQDTTVLTDTEGAIISDELDALWESYNEEKILEKQDTKNTIKNFIAKNKNRTVTINGRTGILSFDEAKNNVSSKKSTEKIVESKGIDDAGAKFSPKTLKELTEEQKEVLKGSVERIVNTIIASKGKRPTFGEFIKILIDNTSKENVDTKFEALAKGYELAYGLKLEDKTNAYINHIQGLEGAIEAFDSLVGEMFVEEQSQEAEQSSTKTIPPTPTNPNISIDNSVKKNEISEEGVVVEVKDNRITDSTPKGAYLSLPYRIKVNKDGETFSIQRVTLDEAQLEESQRLNVKYALDPNNLLPGTELSVRIPDNVQNYLVTLWDNYELDDDAVTTKKQPAGPLSKRTITFGEWEKLPGNQKVINGKLNPKWVAKVPMVASTKGNDVFYIHDNEWYNPNNISDFKNPETGIPDYEKQRATIETARKNLNEIRLQVFQNNGAVIKITEKTWGQYTPLADAKIKGVMPISEVFKGNTDQVMVGTIISGNVVIVKDGKKMPLTSAFPGATIKMSMDFGKGTAVEIRQGSTPNTFHVFQAHRNTLSNESVNNISNILKVITGQLGVEQRTIEKIEALTGVKIKNNLGKINHEAVKNILSKYIRIGINKDTAPVGTPYVEYFVQGDYIRFGRHGGEVKTLNLNNPNVTNLQSFIEFLGSGVSGDRGNAKIFQNFSLENFGKNQNNMMFTIDNNGNLTPTMFYEDFIKTQLKTNIAAYNIGTEEKPNYITFTQPRLNYTFQGVQTSTVKQEEMTAQEVKDAETANGIDTSKKEILPPSPAEVIVENIQSMKEEAERLGEPIDDDLLDALMAKYEQQKMAEKEAELEKELAPIRAIIELLSKKGYLIPC